MLELYLTIEIKNIVTNETRSYNDPFNWNNFDWAYMYLKDDYSCGCSLSRQFFGEGNIPKVYQECNNNFKIIRIINTNTGEVLITEGDEY